MKIPVQQPVPSRDVSADGERAFINSELLPLLRQVREAVNARGSEQVGLSTTGSGAYTTVWTSPTMPTNATWLVQTQVTAVHLSGAVAQAAAYEVSGVFKSAAGVVAQVGTTTTLESQYTDVAIAVRFAVSGSTVLLQVKDNGASAMRFDALVRTKEVVQP